MRTFKHLLTALLLLCSTVASAATVVIDGITYDVVTKAKIATVIAGETEYSGDVVIPETIEYDGVTCAVTSIGERAFYCCSNLKNVVIPSSVKSIGERAFYICSWLNGVHISDIAAWCAISFDGSSSNPLNNDAKLYLNGELVTELVIPDGVTEIKSYAFDGCNSLTSVVIPNSVTSIGEDAFHGCDRLTSVEIPNSVTSIGDYAFSYCTGLTSVVIPNSVTTLSGFSGCSGLTSIEIPSSVTRIGDSAFSYCTGLTSIEIPNSVTSIGWHAFSYCTGLTSIEIPNSVTSIGEWAFEGCTGLTNIIIPNSVTSIGEWAFSDCINLNTVINLTLGTYYFRDANKVINAPNGYVDGDYVWYETDSNNVLAGYLGNAKELTLPVDCKGEKYAIGGYVFEGCSGLTTVVIPNNVTSIGSMAFANCTELEYVYCLTINVPETVATAFDGSYPEYMNLYVHPNALSDYQTTEPWSCFGNIYPMSFDLTVTAAGYATLYLNYAAEIPAGVEVYTANAVEDDRLKMQLVEGAIPANTGVIVKAAPGTYTFNNADDAVAAIEGNLFKGSAKDETVTVASGKAAYVLSMVDGEVGMYRAELTNHSFLNNANKAYLLLDSNNLGVYDEEWDTSAGGQLSNGYRFDFGGITGIDEVKGESGEVKGVYDLSGRAVENPSKGLYIINGKKVMVK